MADLYDVHNAQFIDPPTAEDMDAFLKEHFNVTDTPQHDPTNPEHVTRELLKPFPASAIKVNKFSQLSYVEYQQVIRRLITVTGNRFSVDVLAINFLPWPKSQKGNEQTLIQATVKLTIPVLESSRTHMGMQVGSIGAGEDMWKGAVSDGIKKAAQSFGVAIDLAGLDGEDADLVTPEAAGAPVRPARLSQVQPHQRPATEQHRPAQRVSDADYMGGQGPTEGKRTERQGKALWKISGASRDVIAGWCAEYGVSSDRDLTEAQAAELITKYGGN